MTLLSLCEQAGLSCPDELCEQEVRGITSNSKKVKCGYVFVCIRGGHVDGHLYIGEAIKNGAIAAVVENGAYGGKDRIVCESSRRALSVMLDAFCGQPSKKMRFIGITGTNGKTSVSVMLKAILDNAKIPNGLIGTIKCSSIDRELEKNPDDPLANMTTPDPEELYPMLADMARDNVRYVIMEATSHALSLEKLAPIRFDVAVFTNLTQDHLDFHSSMEEYFRSKAALFDKAELGVINVDDSFGARLFADKRCKQLSCSELDRSSDLFADGVRYAGVDGVGYTLFVGGEPQEAACSAAGRFSVMNSMQATACALSLGIDYKIIKRSLENLSPISGRLEKVRVSEGVDFALFIDYAHTPDALENLIKSVNSFRGAGERIVLLFGCGGDRDKSKRAKMGKVAAEGADLVIITADNSRSERTEDIINDILSGVPDKSRTVVIPDRAQAIEYAIANAKRGDIILLAGKGHENYEINSCGRHSFDEKAIARRSVEKYYGKKRED